jgi:hypothetical protein
MHLVLLPWLLCRSALAPLTDWALADLSCMQSVCL